MRCHKQIPISSGLSNFWDASERIG